jgi:hypothetical protein
MKRIILTALPLIGLVLPALAQITASSPGATPLSPVTVTFSEYYKVEPRIVDGLVAQKVSNDDISVALFLANLAKVTPETVIGYRAKGLSWADITGQLGVKPDVYFMGLPANPAPPYGNAWGYWKKRRAQPTTVFNLADDDLRNLVQLRLVNQYYKVKPRTVIQWRGSGKDFSTIIADQHGKKMGQGKPKNMDKTPPGKAKKESNAAGNPGKGNGQGKDK